MNRTITPRLRAAFENAHRWADARGDDFIGTEAMLAGLLLADGGIASAVLAKCGVTIKDVDDAAPIPAKKPKAAK